MLVRDLMTGSPISVPRDAPIDVAIELIVERNISGLPVVNGFGQLVGLITEFDVLKLYGKKQPYPPSPRKCGDLMSTSVKTIQQNASLEVAANIFQVASLRRLIVLDRELLVGILSRRDIVRAIRDRRVDMANAAS